MIVWESLGLCLGSFSLISFLIEDGMDFPRSNERLS